MSLKDDIQPAAEKIVQFVNGLEYLLTFAAAAEFVHKKGLQVTINNDMPNYEHWVAKSNTGSQYATGDAWLEAVQKYMKLYPEG